MPVTKREQSGIQATDGMQVIRRALLDAECTVDRLSGLQLHGTGTSLGDPIEMGAACAVIADRQCDGKLCNLTYTARTSRQPLLVCSLSIHSDVSMNLLLCPCCLHFLADVSGPWSQSKS